LSNIITFSLKVFVPVLTPTERWQAAGRFEGNFLTEQWFIITSLITVVILTALLLAISVHRIFQQRKNAGQAFADHAERIGLSERERQILFHIAHKAGIKRTESIFTISSAFDRGAAAIMTEQFALRQRPREAGFFREELSFLREKLGFKRPISDSVGSAFNRRRLSSRQIPVGKKIQMTRRKGRRSGEIEAVIIRNDDLDLTVQFPRLVASDPGEFWQVRYQFGAAIWEFDTAIINCEGDILVLSHSDDIRFINRRRFPRVPVEMQGFIARFPFSVASVSGGLPRPEFVPALITELAGPGLLIEATIRLKPRDRVLVIFKLYDKKVPANADDGDTNATEKIVEDIGVVRHVRPAKKGFSIAVELTGLKDSEVNELIRVTNAALLKADQRDMEGLGSEEAQINIVEGADLQKV